MPSYNKTTMLQIIEGENGNRVVAFKVDKCKHDFVYYSSLFENVGIPNLVFFLFLNKQNIVYRGYLFAIKEDVREKGTILYKYPFTNVSNTGLICFGGNSEHLKIDNLCNLTYFADKFFMMPSTHELAYTNTLNLEIRPFLELLVNKEFNDEYLVKTLKTYDQTINDIKNMI